MLQGGSFKQGQHFSLNGRVGQFRLFDDDLVVAKFMDDTTQSFAPADIKVAHAEGQLIFIKALAAPRVGIQPTVEQAQTMHRRFAYVSALDKQETPYATGIRERVIAKVAQEIGDTKAPGASTVGKWHKRWLADHRDISIQVIYKNKQRRSRLSPEIVALMTRCIIQHYLKRSGPTARAAYGEFKKEYEQIGYLTKLPDESTFRRHFNNVSRLEIIKARKGRSEARAQSRVACEIIQAEYPLAQVEIDAAHFNIGLLNDQGYYVGKVALFIVIDVYSRAILGFAIHVGKQSESQACVVHALRHAISVKKDPDYPMYGLFGEVSMDNGPGFRGAMTMKFLHQISDAPEAEPVHMGWAKSFVERWIGTARTGFFQNLDGYLGKYRPGEYTDETLAKAARYTVTEFRERLTHFIVHEYHRTPHEGLDGRTPLDVWNEGVKLTPPVAPYDIDDKVLLRGLYMPAMVLQAHVGITPIYQRFNSPKLQQLREELLSKKIKKVLVDIYVDPLDASAISVVDPRDGSLIEIPNVKAKQMKPNVSFAEMNAGRLARSAADEIPTFCASKVRKVGQNKRPRRGPDVRLEDDSPLNPESIFVTQVAPPKPKPVKNTDNRKLGFNEVDEEEGAGEII